jgi:hypothetical protein
LLCSLLFFFFFLFGLFWGVSCLFVGFFPEYYMNRRICLQTLGRYPESNEIHVCLLFQKPFTNAFIHASCTCPVTISIRDQWWYIVVNFLDIQLTAELSAFTDDDCLVDKLLPNFAVMTMCISACWITS